MGSVDSVSLVICQNSVGAMRVLLLDEVWVLSMGVAAGYVSFLLILTEEIALEEASIGFVATLAYTVRLH